MTENWKVPFKKNGIIFWFVSIFLTGTNPPIFQQHKKTLLHFLKNCFISACLDIQMPVPYPLLCPQDLSLGCFTASCCYRPDSEPALLWCTTRSLQHSSEQHMVKLLVRIPVYRREMTPRHLGFWFTSAKIDLFFQKKTLKFFFPQKPKKLSAVGLWSAFFLTGRQDEEGRKSMYKIGNNQPINTQSCPTKLICLLYSNQFNGHIFHLTAEWVFPVVTWPPDLVGLGCGICPYRKIIYIWLEGLPHVPPPGELCFFLMVKCIFLLWGQGFTLCHVSTQEEFLSTPLSADRHLHPPAQCHQAPSPPCCQDIIILFCISIRSLHLFGVFCGVIEQDTLSQTWLQFVKTPGWCLLPSSSLLY